MADDAPAASAASAAVKAEPDEVTIDTSVPAEVNGEATEPTANGTQTTRPDEEMADAEEAAVAHPEMSIPAKKDATLREFLSKMDDCAPIIPDAVTNYYLTLAGLPPPPATPLPLARLLALATQKFIADIAADAYQYSRIRASNTSANPMLGGLQGGGGAQLQVQAGSGPGKEGAGDKGDKGKGAGLGVQRPGFGGGGQSGGQGRTVLTMEDLGMAVGEYGISVRRGEFYR